MNKKNENEVCILEIEKETYYLNYDRLHLIGRNTENIEHDIVIDDKSVDVKHAILQISQNEVNIIDICSKNGTYIDDKRLLKGEYFKINLSKKGSSSTSIKFGNVEGILKFSSNKINSSINQEKQQENNISDIILPSQESNISQTSRSRLLGLLSNQNFNIDTTKTSLASTSTSSVKSNSKKDDDNFLAPSTQAYRYDENIRKNIELLEEDDDFYIPETQEVFQRSYKNDNHKQKELLEKETKETQQNRIFDDDTEEFMIRINTQDYNATINEETTDSDDLLRSVIMPSNINDVSKETSKKFEKIDSEKLTGKYDKENSKTINDNPIIMNGNNDGNDNETDCEEEMSALLWNESSLNKTKTKSLVEDKKSTSVTPDNLEVESKGNVEEHKNSKDNEKSEQILKSGSTTPDFDSELLKVNLEKGNSKSTVQLGNKSSSSKDNNNVNDNDDDEDDFNTGLMLSPTQPFISKTKKEILNQNKSDNLSKISSSSASNKKNTINPREKLNEMNNQSDDSLEATQIFIYNKDLLAKNRLDKDSKKNSLENSIQNKNDSINGNDSNFLKPKSGIKIGFTTISKLAATSTPHDKTTNNACKADVNDDDDNDDDNDMLEPTQAFIPPIKRHNTKSSSSSIKSNKEKTTDSTITDLSQSILSPFDFDICTPHMDRIKLPTEDKIKEAGKIFNELTKNHKHKKYIFEESSSSSSSNEDDNEDHDNNDKKISIKTRKQETTKNKKNQKDETVEECKPEERRSTRSSSNSSKNEMNSKKKPMKESFVKMTRSNEIKKDEVKKSGNDSDNNRKRQNDPVKENSKTKTNEKSSTSRKTTAEVKTRTKRNLEISKGSEASLNRNQKSSNENKIDNKPSSSIVPLSSSSSCIATSKNKRNRKDSDSSSSNRIQKRSSDDNKTENHVPNKRKKGQENFLTSKSILHQTKPKIIFTKVDSKKYMNELKKIGAKIVNNMNECTILITEQINWTWKFMAAMAKGIPIITPKWLIDAAKTPNSIPSLENYLIKDYESEKKYKFNLRKSFNLAQEISIFDGYSFFITPKTKPPPEELTQIIECGKGKILRKMPSIHQNINKFYVISDNEDMIIWHKIRKNCPTVEIINTEGILMAALQQHINFKNYLLS